MYGLGQMPRHNARCPPVAYDLLPMNC